MPILRARHVYLGGGRWLSPGEVETAGDRIVAVRRARGRSEDVALLPGLVDAHAHLQLEPLARPERAFVPWVRAVMAQRAGTTAARASAAAVDALRELLRSGTTAVGEIDSAGLSPRALARVPFAGRCYQEVLGFDLDAAGAGRLLARRRRAGTSACPTGWSPHAPYSVSAPLFRAAERSGRALAIHAAEVPEEQQFLRTGRGPFADLLAGLGKLPPGFRAPGVGAVAWLDRLGLLGPRTHLVHCQELERGDAQRIARAGAGIVVCPGTITWFGRTAPPVPAWLRLGIAVGLGTDSRASNRAMSMQHELRLAATLWPGLAPATLLDLATRGGAAALARGGLGRIARQARADLFAVEAGADDPAAILAAFVHQGATPRAILLAGRRRSP